MSQALGMLTVETFLVLFQVSNCLVDPSNTAFLSVWGEKMDIPISPLPYRREILKKPKSAMRQSHANRAVE